jgi:hypothetical protein
LDPGVPENEAGVLTTLPRPSVSIQREILDVEERGPVLPDFLKIKCQHKTIELQSLF